MSKEKTDEQLDAEYERRFWWWKLRADFWCWICGGGRGISKRYKTYAATNFYMDRPARMWAMSIIVAEYEGKI